MPSQAEIDQAINTAKGKVYKIYEDFMKHPFHSILREQMVASVAACDRILDNPNEADEIARAQERKKIFKGLSHGEYFIRAYCDECARIGLRMQSEHEHGRNTLAPIERQDSVRGVPRE